MIASEEYRELISFRAKNPLPDDDYGELHHVVPRCCGGTDLSDNVIRLTPEEHYKAHSLLPYIYAEGQQHWKLVRAWNLIFYTRDGIEISQEEYGRLKREFSAMQSATQTGRKASDETRKKMSESAKGHFKTEEHRQHLSESLTGHEVSLETRQKISAALTGRPGQNLGKSPSQETRQKISNTVKEFYAKNGTKHCGHTVSEEQKNAARIRAKAYWASMSEDERKKRAEELRSHRKRRAS